MRRAAGRLAATLDNDCTCTRITYFVDVRRHWHYTCVECECQGHQRWWHFECDNNNDSGCNTIRLQCNRMMWFWLNRRDNTSYFSIRVAGSFAMTSLWVDEFAKECWGIPTTTKLNLSEKIFIAFCIDSIALPLDVDSNAAMRFGEFQFNISLVRTRQQQQQERMHELDSIFIMKFTHSLVQNIHRIYLCLAFCFASSNILQLQQQWEPQQRSPTHAEYSQRFKINVFCEREEHDKCAWTLHVVETPLCVPHGKSFSCVSLSNYSISLRNAETKRKRRHGDDNGDNVAAQRRRGELCMELYTTQHNRTLHKRKSYACADVMEWVGGRILPRQYVWDYVCVWVLWPGHGV